MITFEEEEKKDYQPLAKIKVIGVGGAGNNIVNSMIESNIQDIEYIVANTDVQALQHSNASQKIQLGIKLTKGLGSGANPDIGRRAAEEDLDKVMNSVQDADIVFLTGGMGGGTGSGALAVVAKALREQGILTISIVTKPFLFEGKRRARIAEEAIIELKKQVDTLLILPNQKLLDVAGEDVSMLDAFSMINDVLKESVRGIAEIITKPGHINVDFADLKTIIKDMGLAVMGTGKASGPNRAKQAALDAISSPLLENMSIQGARGVLLNIIGGPSLKLHEINEAASIIYEQAAEDANIILGSVINPDMDQEVTVTIIATGFSKKDQDEIQVKACKLDFVQPKPKEVIQPTISQKALPVIAPVQTEQEHPVQAISQQKKEKKECIDMNDLDVPAYLRKEQQGEAHE
ncbi:cell division protein FtsZ [candidate division TM6 bacterium RIFCSPHIGHO2_12_FULL_36_22]|nr:MAG: cell division protein FtsZ [candidate division TM6 bacterium RIFCSPHIGHO2_12_FULL_36_22]